MLGFDRITFDRNLMAGQACIRGMPITVSSVLHLLAQSKTATDIVAEYPELESEDIQQCLEYAVWLTRERVYF